jgi:hypothetical protein
MHLDNTTTRKPKQYSNPAWKDRKDNNKSGPRPQKGKETQSYYRYSEPSHLAKDCESQNKVIRHINVITRYTPEPDSDDNDWEVIEQAGKHLAADDEDDNTSLHGTALHCEITTNPTHARDYHLSDNERKAVNKSLEQSTTVATNASPPVYGHVLRTTDEYSNTREQVNFRHLNTITRQYEPQDERIVERSDTPHPGTRVPNVWEFQEPDSNEEEDKTLSLQELAIHTPPASPRKRRKHPMVELARQRWNEYLNSDQQHNMDNNWTQEQLKQYHELEEESTCETKHCDTRTRVNEEYALAAHINDDAQYDEDNWTTQANREYQEHCTLDTSLPRTGRYLEDFRNLKHGLISWTACYYDDCPTHYTDKVSGGWYPTDTRRCQWQYYDYEKDTCHFHLYDKRITEYFPGMTTHEEQRTRLIVNGRCTNSLWQVCMMEQCETHQAEKKANGYGTTTFLGKRLAPGVNPGAATLRMPNTSSNSQ